MIERQSRNEKGMRVKGKWEKSTEKEKLGDTASSVLLGYTYDSIQDQHDGVKRITRPTHDL